MEKFNVAFYEYAKNFKREYVTIIDSIESINSMDLIKMLQELHAEYNPSDLNIRIDFDGYCEPNLLVERLETDAEFNKRVRAKYDYEKARYENAREKREREREQELAKLKQQREEIQAKINALQ
jgi:LDH2 family malate/lactate/ureidoglycolate dehydrogenase